MRALLATFVLLCTAWAAQAQASSSSVPVSAPWAGAQGILSGVENAHAVKQGSAIVMTRDDPARPIRLVCTQCISVGVERDHDAWWVLPMSAPGASIKADSGLWMLPADAGSNAVSWSIHLHAGTVTAEQNSDRATVLLQADRVTLHPSEVRPHSDIFGNRFAIRMNNGPALEDALASFYWGTMLPSVVERTMAARYRYSNGYVLSTLETDRYAGSYPAVDHEFQIRGRLGFASAFDLDLVQRMLKLQFRLMEDDPEHLSRAPTSVQPDGRREYHVRRDSEDRRENAAMFPVTGNIEVLEETWRWYEATKNRPWLARHIEDLERSAGWVLANTDQYGRLWSDVYYEDQVIKDGRVTQAQAFAAHALQQLARMEQLLGRTAKAATYTAWSQKMAKVLIARLPFGYWDPRHHRFVDWIDRNGGVHDHVHLLANTLPVTLGFASPAQCADVRQLVDQNEAEFERFPSFLSAHIDQYTPSEIGIAGPYDLSAAGRYWYWDAAYRASQHQNAVLLQQLNAVAAEAAKHGGFMGERYDMDHVYYIDGKDAHGAGKYYEYPNVFTAVLISKYLGLATTADTDVLVAPHLAGYAAVRFDIPAYAVQYRWDKSGFTLTNLSARSRRFIVDLSALAPTHRRYGLVGSATSKVGPSVIRLKPGGQARWTLEADAESR